MYLNLNLRLGAKSKLKQLFYALFGNSITFKDGNQIISSDNQTIVFRG